MIARPAWTYTLSSNIGPDLKSASITVDREMLESILSKMRTAISAATSSGKYEEARELLDDYLDLEKINIQWLELLNRPEETEDEA